MAGTTKTEAIKLFLEARAPEDLAYLYQHDMEVQVNVLPDGEVVNGTTPEGNAWTGWTDGIQTWKHIRIPWNNGEFQDSEMRWSLEEHAEAIGMTGWDWHDRVSRWVGFDFDSLIGHVKGLSDEELTRIIQACSAVPWVTVRRSKSGKGIHLYVFLEPAVPTASRAEHAALARAILALLVAATGLDLRATVDKLGCNLWVWHRDTKASGLSLLHDGVPFDTSALPANWRDHLDVIEGRAVRPRLRGSNDPDRVEDLVGKTKQVQLDPEHQRLLGWLATQNAFWLWDNDRHMLVCHTYDLQLAHRAMNLKGLFYTTATGKERGKDQNCFAFPLRAGGWVVRRHGVGTQEHPAWTRDPHGWTRILFNCPAELPSAAAAHEGVENADGEFVFPTALKGLAALKDLGVTQMPTLAAVLNLRSSSLERLKDNRLLLAVKRESHDAPMAGWLPNKKGDRWETLISLQGESREIEPPDELVRHCVASGNEAGWYILERGMWVMENRQNAVSALIATGVPRADIERLLGQAILNHWEQVVLPFEDEYPGNRRWNKNAARLAVTPKEGTHPTWDAVFRHVGHALNVTIKGDPWCKRHGIVDGGQWLRLWVAAMLQDPLEPLPYLFLWSEEGQTGKSTFHEALSELFARHGDKRRGYIRADKALTSAGGFTGELEGQVLCVVEETNLRVQSAAADRIKDMVTGRTISIHPKGKTPYDVQNSTHWVQCANKTDYCPILPGDSRITMCHVRPLGENEVPKMELLAMLRAEAAAFLWTVLHLELPKATSRLRIPVLDTPDKRAAESASMSELEYFIEDQLWEVQGVAAPYDAVYQAFILYLPEHRRQFWTKKRFSRELPARIVKGRYGHGGQIHLANLSLDAGVEEKPRKLVLVDDTLKELW